MRILSFWPLLILGWNYSYFLQNSDFEFSVRRRRPFEIAREADTQCLLSCFLVSRLSPISSSMYITIMMMTVKMIMVKSLPFEVDMLKREFTKKMCEPNNDKYFDLDSEVIFS